MKPPRHTPRRGFTHTVRFWNALHETNVTEVFHQGLPELAAIHMSADYPNRVVRFQQSEAFRHLAADRAASLLDYVEQTALRRQVDAVRLEI